MFQPFVIFLLTIFNSFHDFHVTHTTIHYNQQRETLEVTVKLAVDDLEMALEESGSKDLRISTAKENSKAEKLIETYIIQRLKISTNDNYLNLDWVGKELSNDLHDLFIYFEIINFNMNVKMKSMLINNSIFTEILPDQSNIVFVELGEQTYNLLFSSDNISQNISLRAN
tara:strand:- start:115 stop:624 length:510 start_codon:yes stop_codon:yes gene_type:complete